MYKMSYKEKMDYILDLVKESPEMSLSTYLGYFPDKSPVNNFWNYSNVIVKKCSQKEHLKPKELYIIHSHAIVDNRKGIHTTMTMKEKADYIYELVKQNPKIGLFSTDLSFPDHTKVSGYWSTIQSRIKKNRESALTEEQIYIYYTSAQIDELQGRTAYSTLVSKIEEIYAYVLEHDQVSLSSSKKKFTDGTNYHSFWDWIQTYIKNCLKKDALTEEEQIVLYCAAKIDEKLNKTKEKNPNSTLEKTIYLYEFMQAHPLSNLNNCEATFPDGTTFHSFYLNLYRFCKKRIEKETLTEKEKKIMKLFQEIRKIQKSNTDTLILNRKQKQGE